jgi:2'-5' RNA ligase
MFPVKMSLKKYFIAILLPEPLNRQIEAIKLEMRETHGLKGALRSPAHITLHRPFEWKEEKEQDLINRLSAFRFPEAFRVEICDFDFFEPRVIFAGVKKNEALYRLHDQLARFAGTELRLFNESGDLRGFHPHVTVAFRDLKKPLFYKLKPVFEARTLSGSFEYKGFSLLRLEKTWEGIWSSATGR